MQNRVVMRAVVQERVIRLETLLWLDAPVIGNAPKVCHHAAELRQGIELELELRGGSTQRTVPIVSRKNEQTSGRQHTPDFAENPQAILVRNGIEEVVYGKNCIKGASVKPCQISHVPLKEREPWKNSLTVFHHVRRKVHADILIRQRAEIERKPSSAASKIQHSATMNIVTIPNQDDSLRGKQIHGREVLHEIGPPVELEIDLVLYRGHFIPQTGIVVQGAAR